MSLVELNGVGRVFAHEGGERIHALRDVSLRIDQGDFVWLSGPSGAGKSTLLRIIGCLDAPTDGDYRYAGSVVAVLDEDAIAGLRRSEFGFVFQAFNLLDWSCARENVELPATYTSGDATRRRLRARELLESVGLGERLAHFPTDLSGGEQQRVAIARALMNGPRLILADEPTGALDSQQGAAIMGLLAALARRGHAVVVATHDPVAATYATRRIELRDGRVASDSGTEDQHPWAATLTRADAAIPAGAVRGFAESIRIAFGSMRHAKLRAVFSILSVTLGIASVVTALGLAQGAFVVAQKAVGRMGADRISISDPRALMSPSDFSVDDARAIETELASVREAVPARYRSATVRYGSRSAEAVGVYAEATDELPQFMYESYSVERGTYLSKSDNANREAVAVIGAGLRKRLFGAGAEALGETILIDSAPFTVKGVLGPHRLAQGPIYTPERADDLQTFVYIPFQAAESLLGTTGSLMIRAFLVDPSRAEEVSKEIRDLLFRRHGRSGFGLLVHREVVEAYWKMVGLEYGVVVGVGFVALIVGGLGVVASMLLSVGQRGREIATRIVVGARRRDIIRQFLVEALVIGTTGAVVGTPVAFLAGFGIGAIFEVPVAYEVWFLAAALGLAIAMALASAILPGARAAETNPGLALTGD